MTNKYYVEAEMFQCGKHGELALGDHFLLKRLKPQQRLIAVLSDGLGSGVKAKVLSSLTATMAAQFTERFVDIQQSAQTIMKSLPVCKQRKISYATFTIFDMTEKGEAQVVEYDNPALTLLRDGHSVAFAKQQVVVDSGDYTRNPLFQAKFQVKPEDRIIIVSDGVTQSGMGSRSYPLGWGLSAIRKYAGECIKEEATISARELAKKIVLKACEYDALMARDDITCGVLYVRTPRQLLLVSGPPFAKERDRVLAETIAEFPGKTIVSGGTTATIVARELGRSLNVDMRRFDKEIPPMSVMTGIDLVTEGILTLRKAVELLEQRVSLEQLPENGAGAMVRHLVNSDVITLIVGTRINEAHQDPTMPVELEIRRNLLKRMKQVLEDSYLKEVQLRFL
jgi:hypothetical protein